MEELDVVVNGRTMLCDEGKWADNASSRERGVDIIRAIAGPRIRPVVFFVEKLPRAADDWECGHADVEKFDTVVALRGTNAAAAAAVVIVATLAGFRARFGSVLVVKFLVVCTGS